MDKSSLAKFNGLSTFTFSKILDENASQEEVFQETCLILISEIIQKKKSGLIFTYGMTNAGKTFTVIGSKSQPGILPKSLDCLYDKIKNSENFVDSKLFANFLEIYNEEVFDLLASDTNIIKNPKFKKKVFIKEKDKKFFVQEPTYVEINSQEDFKIALEKGVLKKVQSSNNINLNSSRSHTIFKIIIKKNLQEEDDLTLTIVDLAGSERANRTEAHGKELQEACKINASLSVLGKCMEALRSNSIYVNKKIVPFRESKLTMLFQEYFNGENNVIMVTNINPRKEDFEETMRALNYSCIAKEIKQNRIKVNNNPMKKHLTKSDENCNINNNDNKDSNNLSNTTCENVLANNISNNKYLSNSYNSESDVIALKEEINILKAQIYAMNNHNFNKYCNNTNNNNPFMQIFPEKFDKEEDSVNQNSFENSSIPFQNNINTSSDFSNPFNSFNKQITDSNFYQTIPKSENLFVFPNNNFNFNSENNYDNTQENKNNFPQQGEELSGFYTSNNNNKIPLSFYGKFTNNKIKENTNNSENTTTKNYNKNTDEEINFQKRSNFELNVPHIENFNLVFINTNLNDFIIKHDIVKNYKVRDDNKQKEKEINKNHKQEKDSNFSNNEEKKNKNKKKEFLKKNIHSLEEIKEEIELDLNLKKENIKEILIENEKSIENNENEKPLFIDKLNI